MTEKNLPLHKFFCKRHNFSVQPGTGQQICEFKSDLSSLADGLATRYLFLQAPIIL